jgi:hypothetical protein
VDEIPQIHFWGDFGNNALAFGAGVLDGATGGVSSAILGAVVPGYNCLIKDNAFFTADDVVGNVAPLLIPGAGLAAVAGFAIRAAAKATFRIAVSAAERLFVKGIEKETIGLGERAAANTAADVARPLPQVEARTLTDGLRPDKLSHVFDPKHNFGPLVETYGSEAGAMEQIVRSLDGAGLPSSGLFEVTTQVGGQSVIVRGAVVNRVARIGTAFTP